MPRPPRTPAILALLLLAAPARADDPPAGRGAVVPSDPVFEARLTDGSTAAGRLARLELGDAAGLALVGDDGRSREFALDRLVMLTRRGDPPPYPPEGSLLVLPEGDRLRALLNSADGQAIEVLPNAFGDRAASVPLDRVLGLVLAPPPEPEAMAALIDRVREDRDGDRLWQANGDRLTGSFLGLDARRVAFDSGAGRSELDRARAVALGLDPALIAYPEAAGPYLEVTFADGSRLGVAACRVEGGRLSAESRLGPALQVPLKEVASVVVRSPRVRYLSELEPAGVQYVGYLGGHPERIGRGATWDGRPLRLRGRHHDRGLGMLPRTLAAYRVEPEDARFQARIGLDDLAGERASVVFRVSNEKREDLYTSPPLMRLDEPIDLDLDVSGSRLLILVVEFGDGGDVQDWADWADARLVR